MIRTFSFLFAFALDRVDGLTKVLFSKHSDFANPLSEPVAPLIKSLVESNSYTHVCTGHTAIGRDIFPRAAALLDISQVSDIIALEGEDTFTRPIYAGNAIATIKSTDKVKIFTVRGTAFDAAATEGGSASTEEVKAPGAEGEYTCSDTAADFGDVWALTHQLLPSFCGCSAHHFCRGEGLRVFAP